MKCALVNCEDDTKWAGFYERTWKECLSVSPNQVWDIFDAFKGEFPEPSKYDVICITGSHYSCYENVPWFTEFFEWIRKIHSVEKPPKTIASCFGHQAVAHALGGTVGKNPSKTKIFGTETVFPTESLRKKSFFNNNSSFVVIESHYDCVLSPPPRSDFEILAKSQSCDVEMYCVGNQTLGIQSHPEMDAKICEEKILPFVHGANKEATLESLNKQNDHKQILEVLRNFLREGEKMS